MIVRSYAKINLALNIEKKLPDNYHALDMINVSISLFDTLFVFFNKSDSIIIRSSSKNVPTDSSNTIYKTIEKFKKKYNLKFGIKVYIKKRIPMQSGMGGGSANAASILKILNYKFNTNMSLNDMIKFISPITSDGPFSLYKYPARVRGKGELVTPIKNFNLDSKIFILKPFSGCNTKKIYTNYNEKNNNNVNINKVLQALKDNNIELLSKHSNNSLKDSIIMDNNDITNVLSLLYQCGFETYGISGSGSTCFGISSSNKIYKNAKKVFKKENYELKNSYKILKLR